MSFFELHILQARLACKSIVTAGYGFVCTKKTASRALRLCRQMRRDRQNANVLRVDVLPSGKVARCTACMCRPIRLCLSVLSLRFSKKSQPTLHYHKNYWIVIRS